MGDEKVKGIFRLDVGSQVGSPQAGYGFNSENDPIIEGQKYSLEYTREFPDTAPPIFDIYVAGGARIPVPNKEGGGFHWDTTGGVYLNFADYQGNMDLTGIDGDALDVAMAQNQMSTLEYGLRFMTGPMFTLHTKEKKPGIFEGMEIGPFASASFGAVHTYNPAGDDEYFVGKSFAPHRNIDDNTQADPMDGELGLGAQLARPLGKKGKVRLNFTAGVYLDTGISTEANNLGTTFQRYTIGDDGRWSDTPAEGTYTTSYENVSGVKSEFGQLTEGRVSGRFTLGIAFN